MILRVNWVFRSFNSAVPFTHRDKLTLRRLFFLHFNRQLSHAIFYFITRFNNRQVARDSGSWFGPGYNYRSYVVGYPAFGLLPVPCG